MKNPEQNARRWLRQAEYDLKQAEKNLSDGSFAYAAFFVEQSAQKSLKAYLLFKGKRKIAIKVVDIFGNDTMNDEGGGGSNINL